MPFAEFLSALASLSCKTLVSDEWWVAGGAFKPFVRFVCPTKKITFMDQRSGSTLVNDRRRLPIVLDSDAVSMHRQKATVTTGRVE